MRITVERARETFRFSALSREAVIPVREVDVQPYFVSGAAERLMASTTREEQEEFGQLLANLLIPQDFRGIIDGAEALTLVLDRSTAAYPWEMVCLKRGGRSVFLGPDLKLTRQFRTTLASPGLPPPLNRSLKVLVIADPAPEPGVPAPRCPRRRPRGRRHPEGVQEEAEPDGRRPDRGRRLRSRGDPGPPPQRGVRHRPLRRPRDLRREGAFGRRGWVFGKGRVLSAKEIFQARRVPRLVFANACFSSAVKERPALTPDEMNRRLAGMAEAFFERGVRNYIGAGWPVDDAPAMAFAAAFYKNVLEGETLGDSLAAARDGIRERGSTWGAYQHYGQVDGVVVTRT